MSARIALMAFVGDDAWDSFSEGRYAHKGGLRDAVESAERLATSATSWQEARTSDGQRYTHLGVVAFPLVDGPIRVIKRFPIERPTHCDELLGEDQADDAWPRMARDARFDRGPMTSEAP